MRCFGGLQRRTLVNYNIVNVHCYVLVGLWFVVCGLWFVVCGLWFAVRVLFLAKRHCKRVGGIFKLKGARLSAMTDVWGLGFGVWGLGFGVWVPRHT